MSVSDLHLSTVSETIKRLAISQEEPSDNNPTEVDALCVFSLNRLTKLFPSIDYHSYVFHNQLERCRDVEW